ncbi:MAG: hypothetical protein ACSHYA_02855 [Opitutaceae bacterium]
MNNTPFNAIRQNSSLQYSKQERNFYYLQLFAFFVTLAWSTLIYYQVQHLPLINVIGRAFTLSFLIFFSSAFLLGIARGKTELVGYALWVGSYAICILGNSAFNGHGFLFTGRGAFFGFTYHFLIFLAGMVFAHLRAYPRQPPRGWFLTVIGVVFFLLSANFYRFVAGSLISFEGRGMIYEGINSISMGYLAGLMGVVFFTLSIRLKLSLHRVIFGLCSFIMVLTLVSVAARGAFLYFFLTVLFMSFLTFRFSIEFIKNLMTFAVVALLGFVALAVFKSEFLVIRWTYLMDRFMPTLDYLRGYQDVAAVGATSGRSELYGYYLEQFGAWWFNGLSGYSGDYPHNFFIEVGVRFGLLGIPILVVLFFVMKKIFILSSYREKIDAFDATVMAIFIFCFLQSMTSMSLEMFRALWASMGYLLILKVSYLPKIRS